MCRSTRGSFLCADARFGDVGWLELSTNQCECLNYRRFCRTLVSLDSSPKLAFDDTSARGMRFAFGVFKNPRHDGEAALVAAVRNNARHCELRFLWGRGRTPQ